MSARALRAAGAPVRLALARVRAAPGRWALVAVGVAVPVALLGIAVGAGALAGEREARDALARLPAVQRDLRVGWSGGLSSGVAERARATLRAMTPGAQASSVLFLATGTTSGPSVQLAAIDPLSRWLRLRSGRLPRTCTARRCEVVLAGGPARRGPLERLGTRLVVVGRGALTSSVPLGFVPRAAASSASSAAQRAPLLVGADPRAIDDLAGFTSVYRSHGWSAPLVLGARPSWRLDALRERMERASNALSRADESFSLDVPTGALAAGAGLAAAARRRLLLVGAGAAALAAVFALLAAGVARRDLEAERARLRRRGARDVQLVLLDTVEGLGPALAGVVAGAAVALIATALRARGSPVPAGTLLGHTLLAPWALLTAFACWLVAGLVIAGGARSPSPAAGRMADVAAAGAAAALALALARGGATAGNPGDPLPTLLVPMALLVAALVLARLVPAALRGIEVAARRGPLALRLATLGLTRGAGAPALTVAMVAIAIALACFAGAYRATLRRGAADQAAFRVPLDVTLSQSSQLVPPLAAAPSARWRALAGGRPVLAVLRRTASVPGAQTQLSALGVPAGELGRLRGASADRSVAELGRGLIGPASAPPSGVPVRDGDRELALRAYSAGDSVHLAADLVGADGSLLSVRLGRAGPTAAKLRARLPAAAAGRTLIALEATEPSGLAATSGHQRAESPAGSTSTQGRLVLRGLRVGARAVSMAGWCRSGALRAPVTAGATTVAPFAFDVGGRALLRPCQPADRARLPILVDGLTARSAGRGGALALVVDGSLVQARVVGTLRRVPTVAADSGFAVADERALASALGTVAPGTAQPDELWIAASPAVEARLRAAVAQPPLSALELRSRRALEQRLRGDPLARELERTLAIAALAALLLGAVAILLAAAAALRDEGAELYELEAVGADPVVLRADVRLRAALLATLGLAAGVAVGAALLTLVVDAVQLTATGRAAFPPLVAVVPWAVWLAAAGAFALACAALVAADTRRALSGDVARPAPGVAP